MNSEILVNKVAESAITTIDLETFYPSQPSVVFDIKPFLFMELILKEKDFREALKNLDWSVYDQKNVAVTCTADAIIPIWAYMLIATYLQPVAACFAFAPTEAVLQTALLLQNIQAINPASFANKRVVIKGCGHLPIGPEAYLEITKLLKPVAKSIMYGEPCSTVPIFKTK